MDIRQWVQPYESAIYTLAWSLGSVEACFAFMGKVRYESIPFQDYVKKAMVTFDKMAGDCDDQAILLCSLLRALGEQAFVRVARVRHNIVLHAWVVWFDTKTGYWENLDSSFTYSPDATPAYGTTIPITLFVDWNDETVYDYDGRLGEIIDLFRG